MKCDSCGITIPELPEDATYDEMLCDKCYEDDYTELDLKPFSNPGYYVMRTHSSVTAKITTWKLMSRRFRTYDDAVNWMEYCEGMETNSRHEFFIVTVWGEEEAEAIKYNERAILKRQMQHMYRDRDALLKVETLVDKIRYAMDHGIQNNYVLDLLDMFDVESGEFKHE